MKIEKELLEDQQVKLTVKVDNEQLEASKRKAARKIARRIKIPGFRPGKAPYHVILRQVGDEALLEESLEILVNDIYPQLVEEEEITPYGPGNLENVISLDPVTLEFVIPLMAEVELGEYKSIRKPYEPPEVTDQDVDAVQQDFRQRQAVEETAERAAEAGDHVYFRISARRFEAGEESEEGSQADLIEERTTSTIIAEDQAETKSEWPFEGFSRELIGMSAGEDKKLVYTFPEDSPYESLREVDAEFSINVEDVKARLLPELDDEFAQSLGEYEDINALQNDIRESLEQRAREGYNADYDDDLINEIIENSTIKYPPQMKEAELNNIIQQLESRLGNQGLDMDIYLKTREMDEQGLRDEAEPVAETRVKRSLVLLEIAKQEEIDVSEEELQEETSRTLNSIVSYMSDSDRKRFESQNALMNLAGNIYAEMRINRTIEFLRALASGEAGLEAKAEGEVEEVAFTETVQEESPQDTSQDQEPAGESSLQEPGDESETAEGDIPEDEESGFEGEPVDEPVEPDSEEQAAS